MVACMLCGLRLRVDPAVALYDTGWRYDFLFGWLCQVCRQRDLGQRRRRGPGHPVKGHD